MNHEATPPRRSPRLRGEGAELEQQPRAAIQNVRGGRNQRVIMPAQTRLKYHTFKGDLRQDVDEWMKEFVVTTLANQETDDSRSRIFVGLLRKEALKWYETLTPQVQGDWDNLCEAFVSAFREVGGEDRIITKLNRFTKGAKESIRSYGHRICSLISKMTHPSPEHMKIHWYLQGLPKEMTFQLRQKKKATLKETMVDAQEYEDSENASPEAIQREEKAEKKRERRRREDRKRRQKNKAYSSDSEFDTGSSDSSSSNESEEEVDFVGRTRSSLKGKKEDTRKVKEESKGELKMVSASLKTMADSIKDLTVHLAGSEKPRRIPPQTRSQVWCSKCHREGHHGNECPNQKNVRQIETEYDDEFDFPVQWVYAGEEHDTPPVYNIQEDNNRRNYSGRPQFNNQPLYQTRERGRCWICRDPSHYADKCPNGKLPYETYKICGNCKKEGHETSECKAALRVVIDRPTYVPNIPRNQTALNYGNANAADTGPSNGSKSGN